GLFLFGADCGTQRPQHQDRRGTRTGECARPAAGGVRRTAGGAVWLLYCGDPDARAGPIGKVPHAVRCRHTPRVDPESLSLRHPHADHTCGSPCGGGDESQRFRVMNAPGLALPSRRRLLTTSGALVVFFSMRPMFALGQTKALGSDNVPPLSGSLKTEPYVDAWIRINADGLVTVFTGKAELGQGIKTALIQVAAEELVIDAARVFVVSADT